MSAPTPDPGIPVLTVGEAATRLGISRFDLVGRIGRGDVKTLMAGGTTMVSVVELERLKASL